LASHSGGELGDSRDEILTGDQIDAILMRNDQVTIINPILLRHDLVTKDIMIDAILMCNDQVTKDVLIDANLIA